MRLIGIAGKLGSGKDYVATNFIIPYIEKTLKEKCLLLSFADQLKVNVMVKNTEFNYSDLYENKTEQVRILLQQEGTENGRNKFGQNIWTNYHSKWMDIYLNRGINNFITCDVRFKNELEYIKKKKGIIIKVISPRRNHDRIKKESIDDIYKYDIIKKHNSECDLDDVEDSMFDYIINNDYDDNLQEQCEKMLKTIFGDLYYQNRKYLI